MLACKHHLADVLAGPFEDRWEIMMRDLFADVRALQQRAHVMNQLGLSDLYGDIAELPEDFFATHQPGFAAM